MNKRERIDLPGAILRALVLITVCVLSLSPAMGQFEGILESKNMTIDETGTPREFTMKMWIKKDMVRIENSAIGSTPGSTIIYRNDRQLLWLLSDEDKTYMEILQHEKGENPVVGPGVGEGEKAVVKRTGKTRKILGYPCEQIFIKRSGEVTEIWATKKLVALSMAISNVLGAGDVEQGAGWSDELTKMGLFPLSASSKIEGKVVESQEVSKIELKTLANELFELPAGYEKQNMKQMLEENQPR